MASVDSNKARDQDAGRDVWTVRASRPPWVHIGFLAVILASPALAQELRFTHLTVDEGLADNTVYSMAQDATGFLWFGTRDGLCRYDGYSFKIYKHEPRNRNSLSSSNAGNVFIDREGIIWIGAWGGGLNRLDPATDEITRFRHDPSDSRSISSDKVQSIFEDQAGRLWIGTAEGGLNLLDRIRGTFTRFQHDPSNPRTLGNNRIWAITQDESGRLFIGTDQGLELFDAGRGEFRHFRLNPPDPLHPLKARLDQVRALYYSRSGVLWVGTRAGIHRFNPSTGATVRYVRGGNGLSDDQINSILEDGSGKIWLGTKEGGLNVLDPERGVVRHFMFDPLNPEGIANDDVRALLRDKSGLIWLCSAGGGVATVNPARHGFVFYTTRPHNPRSLSNPQVKSILEDRNGTLWIATQNGLNQIAATARKGGSEDFTVFPTDPAGGVNPISGVVNSVYEDRRGFLWMGLGGSGVLRYERPQGKLVQYKPRLDRPDGLDQQSIFCFLEDKNGRLWAGGAGGRLYQFDKKENSFLLYRRGRTSTEILNGKNVISLVQDRAGAIWAGTYTGGLFRFEPDKDDWKHFVHDPEDSRTISDDDIRSIYEDSRGRLWVGTFLGGLNCLDRETGQFRHYGQQEGLPEDSALNILEDSRGHLWISTRKYVVEMSLESSGRPVFHTFDKSDWRGTMEFSDRTAFRNSDGEMFFGGTNGVVAFHPDRIERNSFVPPVVMTGFLLFNKPVPVTRETGAILPVAPHLARSINLTYRQSVFSLEFAALNYQQPGRNQYAYRMEGFDPDWTYTPATRRFATYTNLDPGTYEFHFKGSNNDGLWNEPGTVVRITITPPWWKTRWAYSLYALFMFTSGPSLYFWRVRQLRKRQRELEIQVAERTLEAFRQKGEIEAQAKELKASNLKLIELDGFKQNLMGMIVHDLKNPLGLILHAVETQPASPRAALIGHSARQMLTMVLNLLDIQRFEDTRVTIERKDSGLSDVVKEAIERVLFLSDRKNISIFNEIPATVEVLVDSEMMVRVFVNLLSNAVKYSPNNARVTVSCSPPVPGGTTKAAEGYVRVEVRDEGEGIPSDKLMSVFDKFSQVKARDSGQVRSTGIGLTFCKLAVEAHGGEIGVESKEGSGTVFWFTMPACRVRPAEMGVAGRAATRRQTRPSLNDDEKSQLVPFVKQLETMEIYQFSELRAVLRHPDFPGSEQIEIWKGLLEDAMEAENEELFRELLSPWR